MKESAEGLPSDISEPKYILKQSRLKREMNQKPNYGGVGVGGKNSRVSQNSDLDNSDILGGWHDPLNVKS